MSTAFFLPPLAADLAPGFAANVIPSGSVLMLGNYVTCAFAGKKNVEKVNLQSKVKSGVCTDFVT